ncbi:hypothetical protein [Nocardioides convexus]|uniref:SpoIID/LytB domain-containing protein n=1 Tax=Nocardioides convexus TaxID=2712224 RepID=UPI0024184AF2|nr:hypothetical protein [Nocardioides convexus]
MRLLSRTLVTALAAAVGLVVVPAAVDSSPATAATTFSLSGRGWGHAHGMSQYGAQGAATRGLTFRQIVNFYYPGTKVGTATGAIRVLLTKETRDVLVVGAQSGLSVRAVGSATSYPLARAGATHWMIAPTPDNGTSRVWVAVKGKWTLVRRPRGRRSSWPPRCASTRRRARRSTAARCARRSTAPIATWSTWCRWSTTCAVSSPVRCRRRGGPRRCGRRRSRRAAYAAFERASRSGARYDVDDTTRSQVYGGLAAETTATNAAVTATRTEVRSYGGKPAFTQFSSSNGGWTTQGSMPYLVARADPYDPVRTWTDSVTSAEPGAGLALARHGHRPAGGQARRARRRGRSRGDHPGRREQAQHRRRGRHLPLLPRPQVHLLLRRLSRRCNAGPVP